MSRKFTPLLFVFMLGGCINHINVLTGKIPYPIKAHVEEKCENKGISCKIEIVKSYRTCLLQMKPGCHFGSIIETCEPDKEGFYHYTSVPNPNFKKHVEQND